MLESNKSEIKYTHPIKTVHSTCVKVHNDHEWHMVSHFVKSKIT